MVYLQQLVKGIPLLIIGLANTDWLGNLKCMCKCLPVRPPNRYGVYREKVLLLEEDKRKGGDAR